MKELKPGALLAGRYQIEECIGRGGYGAVFRARDTTTFGLVAIKCLHLAQQASPTAVQRFEREAGYLLRLVHPKIVRAIDFGYANEVPYLVCELLDGTPLDKLIKAHGPMATPVVVTIALDVLEALGAAHAAGIVHRDIKPANIFLPSLGTAGPARLIDFGIARALAPAAGEAQLTGTGEPIGTPGYIAPEQAHGLPVSPPSDLYAFGLTLAEMVSGKKIVSAGSELEMLIQHASETPHEIPDLVRRSPLCAIIVHAIQKQAEARYATAEEMAIGIKLAVPTAPKNRTLVVAAGTMRIDVVEAMPMAVRPFAETLPNAVLASPAALPLMATLPHMTTLPNRVGATAQFHANGSRAAGATVIAPSPLAGPLAGPPAPVIPALPRTARTRPPRRTALWAALGVATVALVTIAIIFGGSSSDSSRSSRRTGRSAEGQRATDDSPAPRGLAKLTLAELRSRLKQAGYTVDTVVERSNEVGDTSQLTVHRDATSAEILSTKFAEQEMAVTAQESLTDDGYASHREDSSVLSVRIGDDAPKARALLDNLR